MSKPNLGTITERLAAQRLNLDRCVDRIRETQRFELTDYPTQYDQADVLELNLLRACESVLNMANVSVSALGLGPARSGSDAFEVLHGKRIFTTELAASLKRMTGFQNLLVHQYSKVDPAVRKNVLDNRLGDLVAAARAIQGHFQSAAGDKP